MDTLRIETSKQKEVVDLTPKVTALIKKHKVSDGICHLFLVHTTAALTTGEVGEGTEEDLLDVVEQMIPRIRFRHAHDPIACLVAYGLVHSRPFSHGSDRKGQAGPGHVAVRAIGGIGWPKGS